MIDINCEIILTSYQAIIIIVDVWTSLAFLQYWLPIL